MWLEKGKRRQPFGDGNVKYLHCYPCPGYNTVTIVFSRCYHHWGKWDKVQTDLSVLFMITA